ncbi:T9SS type A sorting domain-containing protein, partial [Sphingobacteriaceae bacterium AH-315-L07]|nr:T9SS type A sorting domain-containing protein [Sphingobacteriaceae bacterium AH-315-L07]MBN4052320.1 T9SS type A sorting domain-containing protein [Sphingobacteriaceae bacterium AH-315-L07]
ISGNYAIVGARHDDEDASGANTMSDAGSAYIFERDSSGSWTEVEKIVASDREELDYFSEVSISGNYAIVGAYKENEDASGANTLVWAGSAYIFERDSSGNWTEVQKIVASDRDGGEWFGSSIFISDNYVIVGAPKGGAIFGGAAYIFEQDSNGTWIEVQKIAASDKESNDRFGWSVSLSNNHAIVGAYKEDEDASGANTMDEAGSAYIFERCSSGNWIEVQKIVASDRGTDDLYGWRSSISNNHAIVGAYEEDEDATGTNTLNSAGSVYFYELIDSCTASYDTITELACNNYISPSGKLWTNSNTYLDTITKIACCDSDSVITINLTIKNSTSSTLVDTACNSYIWSGNIYTASGTYMDTIANVQDCDSLMILNLTIKNSPSSTLVDTACNSYIWSGNIYTASGTYMDTIANVQDCDSLMILNLTIKNSPSSTLVDTACNSYIWSGNIYTASGTYMDTIANVQDCDSLMILNLTISTIDTSVTVNDTTLTSNTSGAVYQWIDCNNGNTIISEATNQTYTATANGSYAVIISEKGCIDTSICHSISTIGILENTFDSSLSIYPNPTTGKLFIGLGQEYSNVTIKVKNIAGQVISTKNFATTNQAKLVIDGESGFYLVDIRTIDGKSAIFKILKVLTIYNIS